MHATRPTSYIQEVKVLEVHLATSRAGRKSMQLQKMHFNSKAAVQHYYSPRACTLPNSLLNILISRYSNLNDPCSSQTALKVAPLPWHYCKWLEQKDQKFKFNWEKCYWLPGTTQHTLDKHMKQANPFKPNIQACWGGEKKKKPTNITPRHYTSVGIVSSH